MNQQQQLRRRHRTSDVGAQPQTSSAPAPATSQAAQPENGYPEPILQTLYVMLIGSGVLSAYINPIGDCDEVYNYWEPTHLLLYGSGMQTWEYSPAYGLRSYLYIGLHALIGSVAELFWKPIHPARYRTDVFFTIRLVLGLFHAFTIIRFNWVVRRNMGLLIALFSGFAQLLSPGLFQASTSYLPQSFSMYMVTLAFASFIEGQGPFWCILWMGVASLIGWPFTGILAACLAIPLASKYGLMRCIKSALLTAVVCLVPSLLVDYHYYRRWMIAVLNIIKYNVFTSHGADLYGVEPWHYLFKNLFLNFNLTWLAFLPMLPIAATIWLVHRKDDPKSVLLFNRGNNYKSEVMAVSWKAIYFLWPTAVFLIIFFSMAHKEERFLYPIYPLIAFGGGIGVYLITMMGVLPISPRFIGMGFLGGIVLLSWSRTHSNVTNYNAPFVVYSAIPPEKASICVGKEWYRFPSSFFLPTPDSELLYLKSGFSGLLPRPFSRSANATSVIPPGMNDLNQEEHDRYSDISKCDFVVDLDLPYQQEPHYNQMEEFKISHKIRFLDAVRTPPLCRAFFIPNVSQFCIVDGSYQLLKRINK